MKFQDRPTNLSKKVEIATTLLPSSVVTSQIPYNTANNLDNWPYAGNSQDWYEYIFLRARY
jgi:hypothetical protein